MAGAREVYLIIVLLDLISLCNSALCEMIVLKYRLRLIRD